MTPHGCARYKLHGCRCYTCAYAVSEYTRRRLAALATGTWKPYADTAPVIAHVRSLMAAGIGYKRIAALAGVNGSTIARLLYTVPAQPRMRTDKATAILAVKASFRDAPDHVKFPAIGTARRIQGLAVAGFDLKSQAAAVGWTLANYVSLSNVRRVHVTAATARKVADLYDAWSMTPAAETEKTLRSRAFAARKMWLPALAWDDDEIDDPAATPCVLPPVDGSDPSIDEYALTVAYFYRDHPISPAIRDEIIRRMALSGYSLAETASVARISAAHVAGLRTRLRLTYDGRRVALGEQAAA